MKSFKAESKKVLDMMINSIYSHKEVFLRELISNCNDAIDKLYYKALTEHIGGISREDFSIELAADKDARTLTISDNGIGMDKDELEDNLGVIAHSGSFEFKRDGDAEKPEDIDIIGQFGVGFYSCFMVADAVTVLSRKYGSDEAFLWESHGAEGYTVKPAVKDGHGTVVTLHLKPDDEDEQYGRFLEQWEIQSLVKKYSDYIRYPINMDVTESVPDEDACDDECECHDETCECHDHDHEHEHEHEHEHAPKYKDVTTHKTLNSMIPLWKKRKGEVTDEEYATFYRDKFFDYEKPLRVVPTSVEGSVSYCALLFIPSHAPYNYYSKEYQKGLQLYSNGVLIMERCGDLLSDCFSFVKGIVDTPDLSLNVSREMLQHDRGLKVIAANLEKKIKQELETMQAEAREDYEKFWAAFGLNLKFGLYNSYGAKKELLQDLFLFKRLSDGKLATLKEFADAMPEGQKAFYYASGKSVEAISHLPQVEAVRDAGFDVLCLTDDVDEFVLRVIGTYGEKEFKSVAAADLGVGEKEVDAALAEESKDLLAFVKETLGDRVSAVKLSPRLKTYPVCLSSEGALSIEMEKVLNSMPTDQKVSAQKVLEINPDHPIFATMRKWFESDKEKLADLAEVLLCQAQLIEGIAVDDATKFADLVCKLIGANA